MRLSVGIEHIDDIVSDIRHGLEAASRFARAARTVWSTRCTFILSRMTARAFRSLFEHVITNLEENLAEARDYCALLRVPLVRRDRTSA